LNNLLNFVDANLRAKMLGDAIPAESFAVGANAMVTDGSIITNAVFDRGVAAMFRSDVSDYEKADILAFHIPAVSSPAGKVAVFEETEAVYLMSGAYDLLLFVSGKTLLSVARFVSEKLSTIRGIVSTATHFRLKTYKQNNVLMAKPQNDSRLVVSP
jgi:DNA-binding Lrp family transcriptional regulator